jgi:type II secretion system protein N
MTARLLAVLAALLAFGAALAFTFPTDLVVRRALARATPYGWPAVVFREARLRPAGLVLGDVTLRDPAGVALAHAASVRLRPSLWSLVAGGGGLPWHVEAHACGGTAEATLAADGAATALAVTWAEADLAACPPLAIAGGALAGRARGAARLRFPAAAPAEGGGDLEVVGATWRGTGFPAVLHADTASVRWRLAAGRVTLDTLDLSGPEVSLSGRGEIRLAAPVAESPVALTLAVRPGGAGAPRPLAVVGTLGRPQVVLP